MSFRDKTSNERGYNYRWQKFRELYLKENPLCVFCENEGKIKEANVVDHIKPHKGDMDLFWDKDNMQPLCTFHHQSTKQAIEKGSDKPIIGLDGWPE